MIIGISIIYYAFQIEPKQINIRELNVKSAFWHNKPIKIAFLSDIHGDQFHTNPKRISEIINIVLNQKPDIVFLGGDYAGAMFKKSHEPGSRYENKTNEENEYHYKIISSLNDLSKAPLGAFAIMGNHDCWWSCEHTRNAFAKTKIKFLENQNYHINNLGYDFYVIGLEDRQTQKPDFNKASIGIPNSSDIITLEHNPSLFKSSYPYTKIMFSGHTHGGQVRFPFIGAPVQASSFTEETMKGIVTKDKSNLVISSGVGETGLPIRLGVPPEILIVNLTSL
ncbi:MAG: metallophosphoesterase [Caulobacterales bacterium]|nr:metallophosphoesterase [Caulobacterales bacterium]